jgi:hypothetical protein
MYAALGGTTAQTDRLPRLQLQLDILQQIDQPTAELMSLGRVIRLVGCVRGGAVRPQNASLRP